MTQPFQGAVSFLLDPDTGVTVGPEWIKDFAGLSPAPFHLKMRTPISSASLDNSLDIERYRQALVAYQSRDFEVVPVLHGGLELEYSLLSSPDNEKQSPNYTLGLEREIEFKWTKDVFLNQYIRKYSNRAVNFFTYLGSDSPTECFVWNEPNLLGLGVKQGQYCPPNALKPAAVSPEVFASMLYVTGTALKRLTPIRTVYPGALSCLVKYATDPAGDWIAGYWNKGFQYLNDNRAYNWQEAFDGLSLNLEGYVTEDYMKKIVAAVQNVKKRWGITGPLIIGEWGIREDSLDIERMKEVFNVLKRYVDGGMFFFQHPTYLPMTDQGYGAAEWHVIDGKFIPIQHTAWYDFLVEVFKGCH